MAAGWIDRNFISSPKTSGVLGRYTQEVAAHCAAAFLRDRSNFNACEKVGLFALEKIAPVETGCIEVKCDFVGRPEGFRATLDASSKERCTYVPCRDAVDVASKSKKSVQHGLLPSIRRCILGISSGSSFDPPCTKWKRMRLETRADSSD